MLKSLMIGAALLGAATALPAHAQGALGASYNDQFGELDYRDLERSGAKWVRMSLPLPQLDKGVGSNGVLNKVLEVSEKGYSTVLSLKLGYVGTIPPQLGSDAWLKDIARLDAVLGLVTGKVDVLVIGNDPFLEVPEKNRDDSFNAYYEAIAKHVIEHRAKNCAASCKTRLYMGALIRLEMPAERGKVVDRWMSFVKATPEIDGVAIQTHVAEVDESKAYLKYILPRMRPDQKFVVTDFSLVKTWEQAMRTEIPKAFADKYGAPRNAQNWQIVKASLETPFSKAQWDEFLSQSPWLESRKHFIASQMQVFRETGRLAVATIAFPQGLAPADKLSPGAAAWQLNSVVMRRSVKRNPDGSAAFNYGWIDDFKAVQKP
ncbi:hypothetical protein P6144_16020 [Sphingomonas sp. HITSZ_GF]|uniref:hypothetical protein n=1 Tax=Sphingomonas sp. HITSZ_GF TaxID=3037247 RepID=UPI00240E310F|nr:hypothetical protein [Sphingomonas sp. HITSZ_GF]MDG2535167.1 hypothetical protein [Sphingomonas sp. HITSZ_GF]